MNTLKQTIADFYLDWVNNYLTVEKMSQDYQISETACSKIIDYGKKYHEQRVKELKMQNNKNNY